MATREELHRLVSSLPEEALDAAYSVLMQLQADPSLSSHREPALQRFLEGQQRVHERLQERTREMLEQLARRKPGR